MQPTLQDNQLMSKHRVLSFKPQLRLEWRGQDGQNETEQPDHSASLGDSITSSTQIRFSVHTPDARRYLIPTKRRGSAKRSGKSLLVSRLLLIKQNVKLCARHRRVPVLAEPCFGYDCQRSNHRHEQLLV